MPLDPVVWPGCVYAWLCTSATVQGLACGRACWAAGQIGESAHPGHRVSAKDPLAKTIAQPTLATVDHRLPFLGFSR
jgi:hypothetical protein